MGTFGFRKTRCDGSVARPGISIIGILKQGLGGVSGRFSFPDFGMLLVRENEVGNYDC